MPLTNEFEVIDEIRKVLGKPSKKVLLGIGDDAAVAVSPKGKMVMTIDTMVEGVHFDLGYTNARELGHKALAVNLSDLAAMGAKPEYALVSLGLKQDLTDAFVCELYEGIKALAKRMKVDIVGGNLVQSPLANIVDIALVGSTPRNYFTRAGARKGDLVAVSGRLGASAAGLNALKRFGRYEISDHERTLRPVINAHLMPEPRVWESLAINELEGVTSMIDISDGLAKELHHLAEQSKVGFFIDEKNLPVTDETKKTAELLGTNWIPWALFGGEDYEILFTVKKSHWPKVEKAFAKLKTAVTLLGEVVPSAKGVKIKKTSGETERLEPRGWNHFVKRRPASRMTLV